MSSPVRKDFPLGIYFFQRCFGTTLLTNASCLWSRITILLFTFVVYACYHASRKPFSVVKNVLHRNCTELVPPPYVNASDTTWCDWQPFDSPNYKSQFALLDSSFLFCYAIFMFVSGFVAERTNLRYFLTIGTLGAGLVCFLLGLAHVYDIHNVWYFIIVQCFGGIFQTAGWPAVVTIMGNWFGEGKTGLIFGVWNSHTSVGNILGTVIASWFVEKDWSYSFIILGLIMTVLSILIFLFLVTEPVISTPRNPQRLLSDEDDDRSDRSIVSDEDASAAEGDDKRMGVEQRPILNRQLADDNGAVGFLEALKVPGVMEFSMCLFFAKLVSYTFLYWLPLYIMSSSTYGPSVSADLSTLFDVGGIMGGMVAGAISDACGMSALTCSVMLAFAIPLLYFYYVFGNHGFMCAMLLLGMGFFVNGPYALITTAVSANLGMSPKVGGNKKALCTITAIIDGTGSIGAAVGPLLAGFISNYYGWEAVFCMLMISDVVALMMLSRLNKQELGRCTWMRQRMATDY